MTTNDNDIIYSSPGGEVGAMLLSSSNIIGTYTVPFMYNMYIAVSFDNMIKGMMWHDGCMQSRNVLCLQASAGITSSRMGDHPGS